MNIIQYTFLLGFVVGFGTFGFILIVQYLLRKRAEINKNKVVD